MDCNNNYVELSAIPNRVYGKYSVSAYNTSDEKVVYCGYLVRQWGHFLVEAVARLWYCLKENQNIDKYVFFTEEAEEYELKGNYKEFFELLGIYEKIEIINTPTRYKQVIVPELGYQWRLKYSQEYKNIFEKICSNVIIPTDFIPSDKIFFTRSKLKKVKQMEFGMDMLDNYFEKNGYKVLSPEELSLSEMICYIRSSKCCATVSGSLPHNMLFAKDEQELMIIERNILNNEIQVDVNKIKALNVTYIDANIALYPINLGCGPFIMSYDGMLKRYTENNEMEACDEIYRSSYYLKKCFQKYMKAYRKEYGYTWFQEDWSIKYTDYIREAYEDGLTYYEKYLNRIKPFKLIHYFMPHYWKVSIREHIKMLRRVHKND